MQNSSGVGVNHPLISVLDPKGKNLMKKLLLLAGLFASVGFAGDTSEGLFVFTQTERSSFWRTAPGQTLTVPVRLPEGATSASLAVRGSKYSRDYTGITTETFTLTLPAATDETTEDVYELTQTFAGNAAVTNTARIGLIAGLMDGAAGSTRCLTDSTARMWRRALSRNVVPVPYGTTALSVDGAEIADGDAGFTGAQGWYALPEYALGTVVPVSLTVNGVTYETTLTIGGGGLLLLVR